MPQISAISADGQVEEVVDALVRVRLPHPSRIVANPVVIDVALLAEDQDIMLHLAVSGIGLLHQPGYFGLVVELADAGRLEPLGHLGDPPPPLGYFGSSGRPRERLGELIVQGPLIPSDR